jgi:hypothetical protein
MSNDLNNVKEFIVVNKISRKGCKERDGTAKFIEV